MYALDGCGGGLACFDGGEEIAQSELSSDFAELCQIILRSAGSRRNSKCSKARRRQAGARPSTAGPEGRRGHLTRFEGRTCVGSAQTDLPAAIVDDKKLKNLEIKFAKEMARRTSAAATREGRRRPPQQPRRPEQDPRQGTQATARSRWRCVARQRRCSADHGLPIKIKVPSSKESDDDLSQELGLHDHQQLCAPCHGHQRLRTGLESLPRDARGMLSPSGGALVAS